MPLSCRNTGTSEIWIETGHPARRAPGCTVLPSGFVYDAPVPEIAETTAPHSRSRIESLVWPPWLPVRARLPLIAQITGAVALVAAVTMPRWSDVTRVTEGSPKPAPAPVLTVIQAPPPTPPPRPAHLNLDVRHRFGSVDLSITVDDKRVLTTKLAGSGKRFGVFGGRAERGFTKTLDLEPGARVVRVRVQSAADKFDQTRVERFDLDSASVATLRIAAEKAGLSVVAERPPAPAAAAPVPMATTAVVPAATVPVARQATSEASALSELYQTLRSILIALAGFIASAATGFLVQEYLRRRKSMFAEAPAGSTSAPSQAEKRRRRRAPRTPDMPAGAAG